MEPFDSALKSQHVSILEALSKLETSYRDQNADLLSEILCELYDTVLLHHCFEWNHFFFNIWKSPQLNQGGPFCTYFFDSFIRNRPKEEVLRLLKNSSLEEVRNSVFEIPDEVKEIFKANSMASIPLEEHLALQLLLECMIQSLTSNIHFRDEWFKNGLVLLGNLLKRNIEKEETCLWVLAKQSCLKMKKLSQGESAK